MMPYEDNPFGFDHHREQIDGRYTDGVYPALDTLYTGLIGWIDAETKWYASKDKEIREKLNPEDTEKYEKILGSIYDVEDEVARISNDYKIYDDSQSLDFEWGINFIKKECAELFDVAIQVKELRDRFLKLTDQSQFES